MRGIAIAVLVGAVACEVPSVVGVHEYTPAFEVNGTEVEECDYEPIASVEILLAHIVERQLKLYGWYGGGCADHAFKLCWDGAFETSSPLPVARLRLVHENNLDTCEGGQGYQQTFDLSPLVDAWLDAPEHEPGPIQLRIDDGLVSTSSTLFDPDTKITCDPLLQDCPAPDLACLDVVMSDPTVACTEVPWYAVGPVGCFCGWIDSICEPGLVCNRAPVAGDCLQPLSRDAGCCVPACRVDADSPCPDAAQHCVPLVAGGAAPGSGLCTFAQ